MNIFSATRQIDLDNPDGLVDQECFNKYPPTRAYNINDGSTIDCLERGHARCYCVHTCVCFIRELRCACSSSNSRVSLASRKGLHPLRYVSLPSSAYQKKLRNQSSPTHGIRPGVSAVMAEMLARAFYCSSVPPSSLRILSAMSTERVVVEIHERIRLYGS